MHTDVYRRLVNAKYVLERASSIQAERNEMSISLSVLLMHDAVELLMVAILDHLNIADMKKREFKDFWPFAKQASGIDAPDKMAMERLNTVRVALKHSGILPNPAEARSLLARTKGFFENVLTLYCDKSYSDISMIDLVTNEEVQNLVKNARDKFKAGDKDHAMVDLKVAFHKVRHPEGSIIPGIVPPKMPSLPNEMRRAGWESYLNSLHSFMQNSATVTNSLMLGIDPVEYSRFVTVGPTLQWTMAGTYTAQFWRSYSEMTLETFDELLEFLIDYALKVSQVAVAKPVRTPSSFAPHWEKFGANE